MDESAGDWSHKDDSSQSDGEEFTFGHVSNHHHESIDLTT